MRLLLIYMLSGAVFVLKETELRSCVRDIWSTQPEILTVQPFTGNVCTPQAWKHLLSQIPSTIPSQVQG